jgi:dynein heavy chain
MAKTQTLNRTDKMVKLWAHEASRVFHDRLVNTEDKRWFTELVSDLVKSVFRMDYSHADLFESKPLIFGDFMKRGVPFEERQYDEVKDIKTMSQCIMEY